LGYISVEDNMGLASVSLTQCASKVTVMSIMTNNSYYAIQRPSSASISVPMGSPYAIPVSAHL